MQIGRVCRAARLTARRRSRWIFSHASRRRAVVSTALVLTTVMLPALCLGATPKQEGDSSRKARADAVRSIPFEKIDDATAKKIASVIDNSSIFRRFPTRVIDCDPKLYLFLVRNPDVVVNIWEVMGISKIALRRTGEHTFEAADRSGTQGTLVYCVDQHDTHVIYAEGTYDGPLVHKPVKAKCVLLLKSGYMRETNRRYYVTNRLDTFIQIEHAAINLLAKSFQPLLCKSADYNFTEATQFVSNVSRVAEQKPRGMAKLAYKLTNVSEATRHQFASLALEVADNAAGNSVAIAADGAAPRSARAEPPARQTVGR